MVQSRFRPPLSPAQAEKLKAARKHWQNLLVVRLLCGSSTLKELVTTDIQRRILIDLKYKLSKHKLYGLLKDYATNPYDKRWEMVQKELWGGDEEFTLRDHKKSTTFKIEYTPAGIEHRTEDTIINPDHLSFIAASNHGVTYDMLDDDELLILFYVIIGAEDIKKKLDEIEIKQRQFKIQKSITDLY